MGYGLISSCPCSMRVCSGDGRSPGSRISRARTLRPRSFASVAIFLLRPLSACALRLLDEPLRGWAGAAHLEVHGAWPALYVDGVTLALSAHADFRLVARVQGAGNHPDHLQRHDESSSAPMYCAGPQLGRCTVCLRAWLACVRTLLGYPAWEPSLPGSQACLGAKPAWGPSLPWQAWLRGMPGCVGPWLRGTLATWGAAGEARWGLGTGTLVLTSALPLREGARIAHRSALGNIVELRGCDGDKMVTEWPP